MAMPDFEPVSDQHAEFKASVDVDELTALLPDAEVKIEAPGTTDPWVDSPFGGGWGEMVTDVAPAVLPVSAFPEAPPQPVTEKPESAGEQAERKEVVELGRLRVSFDADYIRSILDDHPEFIGEVSKYFVRDVEHEQALLEKRRIDLQKTLDAIASLPELDFQPGKTLILGDNGYGKSTLARALMYAADTAHYAAEEGITLEQARQTVLNLERKTNSTTAQQLNMSGMSQFISLGITVEQLDHSGSFHYYDAADIMGRHTERNTGVMSGGTEVDQSFGRSHRQTVDRDLFGEVEKDTAKALKAKAEYDAYVARGEDIPIFMQHHMPGAKVYFFDEPEVGMSPRRQRRLDENLDNIVYPGSTMIIPTNSIVLEETDLPRIDLELHPERGIYRPSDFPDDDDR